MTTTIHTIRIYRDDNDTIDPEYLAVVNDAECYITELLKVHVPEWDRAEVRLGLRIEPPHPGLLDGTVRALDGWHYLIEHEGVIAITWREDQGEGQYTEYPIYRGTEGEK